MATSFGNQLREQAEAVKSERIRRQMEVERATLNETRANGEKIARRWKRGLKARMKEAAAEGKNEVIILHTAWRHFTPAEASAVYRMEEWARKNGCKIYHNRSRPQGDDFYESEYLSVQW